MPKPEIEAGVFWGSKCMILMIGFNKQYHDIQARSRRVRTAAQSNLLPLTIHRADGACHT